MAINIEIIMWAQVEGNGCEQNAHQSIHRGAGREHTYKSTSKLLKEHISFH